MCCISIFQVSSLVAFKLFFLFELFCSTVCEDYYFAQGTADSRNFLGENLSNQGRHLQQGEIMTPFINDKWYKSSEESEDFSFENASEPSVYMENEERQLTQAQNVSQLQSPRKRNSAGEHLLHQSKDGANEKSSFLGKTGSLPEEKALGRSLFTVLNETLSQDQRLLRDTCSVTNHSLYDRQTCLSGHQYELEPHLSSNYLEDLKVQMLKIYPPRNKTECGYRRLETPDKDITERVLCPFQWVVSQRNPSRIPEYLYEAKCSCPDCKEFKWRIPVLWRVGCNDQLHVYREGWEEIVVAYVPTKPPITHSQTANSNDFPPHI